MATITAMLPHSLVTTRSNNNTQSTSSELSPIDTRTAQISSATLAQMSSGSAKTGSISTPVEVRTSDVSSTHSATMSIKNKKDDPLYPTFSDFDSAYATLIDTTPLVRFDYSNLLKLALKDLNKISSSMEFTIGDEKQVLSISGLVLYYLHIIQLNETPDTIRNDLDYAAKAFQTIDGCTSTPDQRTRACLYAKLDMHNYALQKALREKNFYLFEKHVTLINFTWQRLYDLLGFDRLQLLVGNRTNFKNSNEDQQAGEIEQMRQMMKEKLNLP